uniref:Protein CNPPD1 n=1 Tax=Pelodiscus sinensis TaxID=13735 RepID=K7FQ39_PELSI
FLPGHQQLSQRVRKRLYYSWDTDCNLDHLSSPVAGEWCQRLRVGTGCHCVPTRRLPSRSSAPPSHRGCVSEPFGRRLPSRSSAPPSHRGTRTHSGLKLCRRMVASKYLYDEGEEEEVFNDEWGAAGKVDVQTLNRLEMNFLRAIDWSLYTDPKELFDVLSWLEGRVAKKQGTQSSWFTYTDLCVLLEQPLWQPAPGQVLSLSAQLACVLGVMYLTGVAAVFASVTVVHQAM